MQRVAGTPVPPRERLPGVLERNQHALRSPLPAPARYGPGQDSRVIWEADMSSDTDSNEPLAKTWPAPSPEDNKSTDEAAQATPRPREIGGPRGLEPTRYGDWERKGRCIDF